MELKYDDTDKLNDAPRIITRTTVDLVTARQTTHRYVQITPELLDIAARVMEKRELEQWQPQYLMRLLRIIVPASKAITPGHIEFEGAGDDKTLKSCEEKFGIHRHAKFDNGDESNADFLR